MVLVVVADAGCACRGDFCGKGGALIYLAATFTSLVYLAGYLHGIGYNGHAYVLGGLSVFALSVLFNRAESRGLVEAVKALKERD